MRATPLFLRGVGCGFPVEFDIGTADAVAVERQRFGGAAEPKEIGPPPANRSCTGKMARAKLRRAHIFVDELLGRTEGVSQTFLCLSYFRTK